MERFIYDKTNGLNYELVGDYYLPCLKAPESPKVSRFGLMYLDYLRNHKRVTYSGLMLSGELKAHIEDVDHQADEMFFRLVNQLAKQEGVTEKLKADNQMLWVRKMNNIRNRATEIVNNELIYT